MGDPTLCWSGDFSQKPNLWRRWPCATRNRPPACAARGRSLVAVRELCRVVLTSEIASRRVRGPDRLAIEGPNRDPPRTPHERPSLWIQTRCVWSLLARILGFGGARAAGRVMFSATVCDPCGEAGSPMISSVPVLGDVTIELDAAPRDLPGAPNLDAWRKLSGADLKSPRTGPGSRPCLMPLKGSTSVLVLIIL